MKISGEQKKEYGQRILMLRTHLGLTLEAFSAPLTVGFKTVSNYERGNAKPSKAVVRQLEDVYLMNRNWFESGLGKMILPPKPAVEYDNTDHEEDNDRTKPITSFETEQFLSLRSDQKKMLAVWEKLDCEQRIALMALAKLFIRG